MHWRRIRGPNESTFSRTGLRSSSSQLPWDRPGTGPGPFSVAARSPHRRGVFDIRSLTVPNLRCRAVPAFPQVSFPLRGRGVSDAGAPPALLWRGCCHGAAAERPRSPARTATPATPPWRRSRAIQTCWGATTRSHARCARREHGLRLLRLIDALFRLWHQFQAKEIDRAKLNRWSRTIRTLTVQLLDPMPLASDPT